MPWVIVSVVLAVAGLAVLGLLALRVHAEVTRLSGQVQATSAALARAVAELHRAAAPLAERTHQADAAALRSPASGGAVDRG